MQTAFDWNGEGKGAGWVSIGMDLTMLVCSSEQVSIFRTDDIFQDRVWSMIVVEWQTGDEFVYEQHICSGSVRI